MDEKLQLAGDPREPIARPASTSTLDDSDFEFHDDTSTLYTPRTSIIENTHPDLPPTYEQSQAAIHDSAGVRPPPAFPYPTGAQNHSNITVYRTEIPPDPVVPIRGQGEDNGEPRYPNEKERSVSPTGPKASGLLSEALRFTETPPPVSGHQRLRFPVGVPSITRDPSISKFARFFAAVLETQSVTASEFLDFVDGLNALATASSFTTSTFQTRSALSSFQVPRDDADIPREDLISAYIALSNTHFFNPRGLQVQIADLAQLADLVNMSNPAIRKAILEEVLRNSKAGVDLPAAANGAAHTAAEAMVPYIEPLTTAVPEPKKNTESMESVASRLAALGINNEESIPRESTQEENRNDDSRAQFDPSQLQRPHGGPSRPPTWAEWGDQFGRKWGKWGEYQGRKWGDWGQAQGEFWGKWGEEKGRKFEHMGAAIAQKAASPPWVWRGGGIDLAGRLGGGPFGHRGGPCGGSGRGRHGPFGGNGGPFGNGRGPFGPHGSPFGGGVPFGRRAMTQPYAQPPAANYANVPIPPIPGQSSGHIPPTPPMPGATPAHPSFRNIHHPPPPPAAGPFGLRGELPDNKYQEDEEDDFDDVASISSSSTDSSTSTADPSASPSQIFSEKVAAIETMAATARANNTKPLPQIEKERARAIHIADRERRRREWAMEKGERKREMKRDRRAWKEDGKNAYREWKSEKKAVKRAWKEGAKGEYRGWKEEIRRARREGKRRDGGWEGVGRGRHGGRGGRFGYEHEFERGGPSMEGLGGTGGGRESLNVDVEVRAKEMLWVVLTNYE
ncbi:hypothetical protein EG328_011662 [Venturia inaequalis]|uniref:Uncharacterized protein n=1 Tax=Venturia inaequalis TaxID=5025 RepID=A0A8H3VFT7_VENIN|nr:hypothetical protein EG328_011662 [Venturia inaequalis]